MAETKTYIATDKAGPRVAGRLMPLDADGKPIVGTELQLTEIEAEYELAQGTIALATAQPSSSDAAAKAKRAKPDA